MTELKITDALRLGVEAHKAGKIQEADRYYTAILKIQPNHPDANHNLGILAVIVDKIEQAIPLFQRALETNPKIPQFWLSFIDALLKDKQLDTAHKAIIQAKEHGVDEQSIQKFQSQLTQLNNQTSKKQRPDADFKWSLNEALRKASKHEKNGSKLEAKLIYEKILTKFPKNKRAIEGIKKNRDKSSLNTDSLEQEPVEKDITRIVKLYTEKEFSTAIREIEDLLEKFPVSATLYNLGGTCSAAAKNYRAAIKYYEKALRFSPNNTEIFFNLGNSYKDDQSYERAIYFYEQILRIDTKNAVAANNIGVCYKKLSMPDKAASYYKAALIIDKNYTDACFNLGAAARESGNLEKAIDIYNKCIAINPEYAPAYNGQGLVWMEQGDILKAVDWYNKAIKIDPANPDSYNNLGMAFQELDRYDLAIKYYRKSIDLNPTRSEAYSNLGSCLNREGNFGEAVLSLETAVKINPSFLQAYSNLSISLFGIGNFDGAIEAHKKSLEIDPLYSPAWSSLHFPIISKQHPPSLEDLVGSISCNEEDIDKFNQLKSVSNYLIHAGGALAGKYFEKARDFYNTSTSDLLINPSSKNKSSLFAQTTHYHKKIIALTHFGRSGTGLFHSLIDGHSSISSLPSIYFSEFFEPENWRKIISGGWDNTIEKFMTTYDVLFDANSLVPVKSRSGMLYQIGKKEGMTTLGVNKSEVLSVDREVFKKELKELLSQYTDVTSFDFFHLVHTAYDLSIGDTGEKRVIFYHIHNPSAPALINFSHFSSDINWVMMVREPIQCCESWLAKPFSENEFNKVANRIQLMLLEIDNIVYSRQNAVGVKLEDVKNDPHKTLLAFCKWMDVEEEASLYEMSAQGKRWWGDPSSRDFKKDGMNPFGKRSISRKAGSVFSERDRFILQTLFYPFSAEFGYVKRNTKKFKFDLDIIRPMLNEMFDFEQKMARNKKLSDKEYMSSGPFHSLRAILIEKWDILKTHGTYHNMIKPLT